MRKKFDSNATPESAIEKLLAEENLPPIESSTALKEFSLKPSEEILKTAKESSSLEKRQFTRIDNRDADLKLNFSNETQFARQYIQNISLGGLFVKTNLTREIGAVLPVDFQIKVRGQPTTFRLNAKVCRQTNEGLGLQFLDLTDQMRSDLEAFIKESLPEGEHVVTPNFRNESLERLEKARELELLRKDRLKKFAVKGLALAAVLGLNVLLIIEPEGVETPGKKIALNQEFEFGKKKVKLESVRSLKMAKGRQVVLKTADGSSVSVPQNSIHPNDLPDHFKKTYMHLKNKPKPKRKQRSGSAPKITKQRR